MILLGRSQKKIIKMDTDLQKAVWIGPEDSFNYDSICKHQASRTTSLILADAAFRRSEKVESFWVRFKQPKSGDEMVMNKVHPPKLENWIFHKIFLDEYPQTGISQCKHKVNIYKPPTTRNLSSCTLLSIGLA